jgi:prepilin-type N-terminal cleavage/methylation domain-containing protein/prepilin-type processing-associated H-X9-DG protein
MKHETWPVKRSSAGFTLVELLVVIAIVSIFAALLEPVLIKARDQARSIACMNNLRQLGVAFAAWRNDHEGKMPHFNNNNNTGYLWYVPMGPPQPPAPWPTGLNYFSNPAILHCPSNSKIDLLFYGTFAAQAKFYQNTYAFNQYLSEVSALAIPNPSRTVVLSDSLSEANGYASAVIYPRFNAWANLTPGSGSCVIGRLHNNAPNMLLFDGHVENVAQKRWIPDFDWNKF